MRQFKGTAAFYADDPRRRTSAEIDYGVCWQDKRPFPRWRVSYIQTTGEVYRAAQPDGQVELLGIIRPSEGKLYYLTLDGILEGWPDYCKQPNGIAWIQRRLLAWSEL